MDVPLNVQRPDFADGLEAVVAPGGAAYARAGRNIFIMSADSLVVRAYFDGEQTGLYAAAAMIGRALVFFTVPLAAVMFPKIVQSAARARKSDDCC